MKIAKKWIFHLQMKLCWEVSLINNFQWQSCSCICLGDNCEKLIKKIKVYLRILQ